MARCRGASGRSGSGAAPTVRRGLRAGVVLGVLIVFSGGARAEIIDRILATVDGRLITLSDVTAALRFGFVEPPPGSDPVRFALDRLVERELMLTEVDRYGPPEPSAAAIDAAAAAVRARFGSPSQLAAALAQAGLAEDHLRRRLRDDLRIRAYLDQRFAALGQPSDRERREVLEREWIAGLRRRAEVNILYGTAADG